jgi:hypothetical protein
MNVLRFEPRPRPASREAVLSAADLPPAGRAVRWVPGRKKQILRALDRDLITLAEVCRRYDLTREEIDEWRRAFERHGTAGLKVTKQQSFRRSALRRERPDNDAPPVPALAASYAAARLTARLTSPTAALAGATDTAAAASQAARGRDRDDDPHARCLNQEILMPILNSGAAPFSSPSPRAAAVAEGLVRTGRASDPITTDGYIRLVAGAGQHYWVSSDGQRVLRGPDLGDADELQAGFIAAMERAGAAAAAVA